MITATPSSPLNAIADLSGRAIFRLSGPDAVRYLNGQVSQDVRLASGSEAVYSITANFKGKLEGDFYIRKHDGYILIDTDLSQRESLFMRLDKYLIADDAELVDITEEYSLVFSTGLVPTFLSEAPQWKCVRFGVQGTDHLLPKGVQIETDYSSADWDKVRISNGIPAWGNELDNSVLPPDAGIESTAVSYTKGCYTGQEVISRMKSSGKTNRHLVRLSCENELVTPTEFYAAKGDAKPAGTLTSITDSEDHFIGLGYRTRKHQDLNEFVTTEGDVVKIC